MRNGVNGTASVLENAGAGIYSIGAVARMLGLERATIRNWEDRFELVRPERSAGDQRLFSEQDVERLRFVAGLVAAGMRPGEAHQCLHEHLAHGWSLRDNEPTVDRPTPTRALLAERDPIAADLTASLLRSEGYEVESVLDADEALSRYERLRPRLAIVDLLIGGGAGLQLCRSLKQHGSLALIAVSPLAIRELALEAGADAFLLKPVDPIQLLSAATDLVGPACPSTLTIARLS
jgi:CheY-like chemotaxis protein